MFWFSNPRFEWPRFLVLVFVVVVLQIVQLRIGYAADLKVGQLNPGQILRLRPVALWDLNAASDQKELAWEMIRKKHGKRHDVAGTQFDGSGYVNLGRTDVDSKQFSILAFARPNRFDVTDARLVSKATSTDAKDHHWMLSTCEANGGIRLRGRLLTESGPAELIGESHAITAGKPLLATLTYDGARTKLFANQSQVAEAKQTGRVSVNSHCDAWVGDNPSGQGSRPFQGDIYMVAIFNRALTAGEIAGILTPPRNPKLQSVVRNELPPPVERPTKHGKPKVASVLEPEPDTDFLGPVLPKSPRPIPLRPRQQPRLVQSRPSNMVVPSAVAAAPSALSSHIGSVVLPAATYGRNRYLEEAYGRSVTPAWALGCQCPECQGHAQTFSRRSPVSPIGEIDYLGRSTQIRPTGPHVPCRSW